MMKKLNSLTLSRTLTSEEIIELEKKGMILSNRNTLLLKNLPDIFKDKKKEREELEKEIQFLEFLDGLARMINRRKVRGNETQSCTPDESNYLPPPPSKTKMEEIE